MQETNNDTRDWPELAIGLYDQLTKRKAEITYQFKDMTVGVPSSTSPNADHAHWKLDGDLVIRTRDLD